MNHPIPDCQDLSRPQRRAASLQRLQFAREQLRHVGRFHRVVAVAIEAHGLSCTGFAQRKAHRLVAFRTGGCGMDFGHGCFRSWAGARHSQSPINAEGRAVIGTMWHVESRADGPEVYTTQN